MVSFLGWFSRKKSEDYGQVLESLKLDIQKRQTRLSEIRLRERRSTLLFSVYALAFWAIWSGLWYAKLLPNLSGHDRRSKFEKAVKSIPVFVGPIVILFIRRIVQIWYTRIGDAEEKALTALRKKQRDKVEEFKSKTNYYSTRNLIERYDEGTANSVSDSPPRIRVPQSPPGIPATPQRGPQPPLQTPAPAPISPPGQQRLSPSPQRPLPPPRKQWYDKLADAILGDDEGPSGGASSRYALICQKCFVHNGLVKESMWQDAQYVCPKCGYFNPSARSVREGRTRSKSADARGSLLAPSPVQSKQSHALAPPVGLPVGAQGPATDMDSPPIARRRTRREDAEDEDSSVMDVDS
ncbi:uncharacterized protein FIBRA_04239 [Fibroporia radiculosa]|uniref:Endoplasmic reticulum junction formation protein lunapark n=1 Tax=Fibroporia radiculosa TaxID=599839 RepID=J4IA23_9APHY|nr:uncharacterized protein FIBRA_04239 [Fibroporia radiculosa]CCM02161.1 predicted protein [Fibroporia radiculosa]